MRDILDRLFYHRKLSLIIPWITVAVVYLLFVVFGAAEDKTNMLIMTPFITTFWFFGVFFLIFFQIRVTSAPDWFLDLVSLAVTICFVFYGIIRTITFFAGGFEKFDMFSCAGLITYASVAWAHSKRKD